MANLIRKVIGGTKSNSTEGCCGTVISESTESCCELQASDESCCS